MKRLLLILFLAACAGDEIDRHDWQSMTPQARLLYVKALLGEEQANAAKGGVARSYPDPPETYVARISEAYARAATRATRRKSLGVRRQSRRPKADQRRVAHTRCHPERSEGSP